MAMRAPRPGERRVVLVDWLADRDTTFAYSYAAGLRRRVTPVIQEAQIEKAMARNRGQLGWFFGGKVPPANGLVA